MSRRKLFVALMLLPACGVARDPPADVAREFLLAVADQDAPAAWDLGSTRYHNFYAEIADEIREPDESRLPVVRYWAGKLAEEAPGYDPSPLEVSGVVWMRPEVNEPPPRPRPEAPFSVEVEGDTARVDWPEIRTSVYLRREAGRWRVEATGRLGVGELEIARATGGRELALLNSPRITRKTRFDGLALPRLPGERNLPFPKFSTLAVRLESNARTLVRRESVAPADREAVLTRNADIERDLATPMQYSAVRLDLGVDREAPWAELDALLRVAAGPEARFRHVAFWTAENEDGLPRGVPATVASRFAAWRKKVRYEPIPLSVLILSPPDGWALAGLTEALAARPEKERAPGLRVTLAGSLRSEDALSALIALSTVVRGPLVLESPADGAAGGPTLNGEPAPPAAGALAEPEEAALDLMFEY